jgi:tetratricopeptide (TPR) repeat protein
MRRSVRIVVGPLAVAIAATVLSPRASSSQVAARDTARKTVADSTRKAAGVSAAAHPSTVPSPDVTRTVDAEARVAMFELASGQSMPALSRLERLSAIVKQDSMSVPEPERAALHFLLAQTYYRLGMLASFRREAEGLAAGSTRYASVLRPQLLVEAYRSGDYARVATVSRTVPAGDPSGLAPLVTGLAAYQSGDLAAARSAFSRASTSNGPFSAYAKYMGALAQLRTDTTHAANSIATLEAVANEATGSFADQVRLTAAQVAYEGERYEDAVRFATAIGDSSQLAAPALLTRAWALYKLERVQDAERAFSEFGSRYPRRPEYDEARLMAAQAQLELGQSVDAERVFQQVADSSTSGVAMLQAQTNAAIAALSRALVASRSADMLAVGDPAAAKALVLTDSSSASDLLATLSASPTASSSAGGNTGNTGNTGSAGNTAVVAVPLATLLDSVVSGAPAIVQRVLFAPASATKQPREVAARSQNLVAADAAVSVARHRLNEQLVAQQREVALLTQLSTSLAADSAAIGALALDYQTVADSMAKLDQLLASAEARVRGMLGQEIEATRSLAAENAKTADSLRTLLESRAGPEDKAALDAEVATAAAYARIAELAATGLDRAIAHHPTFVARDSLRAHDMAARSALATLQSAYSGSRTGVAAALTALRAGDSPDVQRARQALADAESRRASAESEAIAAVNAELSARAEELVASLQRSTEAAQFGVASAAFFRAIDGTRTVGGAGRVGASRVPAPERRR